MRTQRSKIYVADFETTVYDGQTDTQVWAAAIVELFTEDVTIYGSLPALFDYLKSVKSSVVCYFHNLKFDGEFWLSYLLTRAGLKQAFIHPDPDVATGYFKKKAKLKSGEFIYSISEKGQWYSITIKNGPYYIELRDSLKLLPVSVEKLGKSFGTKHRKLTMEYKGFRYPNCAISEQEREYIANDVLVVKEAIEIMYQQGHEALTIGSCCLREYKNICPFPEFDRSFPNLYELQLDKDIYGAADVGTYIKRSYHGGWCYLVDGKENRIFHNGTTADVNSLYPSMMHSESGNRYPTGNPTFWTGNFIPDEALEHDKYYFVRIRTRFRIKKNRLPCIKIKNSPFYPPNRWLITSDYLSRVDGKYHPSRIGLNGDLIPATVTLTLTMTDYELIKEQYYLKDCTILDGCYFKAYVGFFDDYIDKYKAIKIASKGAQREIAKLFLNNLYGKFATNTNSSFKVAYIKEDGSIGYYAIPENEKKPGYIPIGSAITSYARNFTIRAAQANYYGPDKPGFIYADTDSIHCDIAPSQLKEIKADDTAFCCWKLEGQWDDATFIRQKCYAEHITHENLKPVSEPYWSLKCAGMPENCKELFLASMNPLTKECVPYLTDVLSPEEQEFLSETRTISDFKVGLVVPGKLVPKRIQGGVLLTETLYTLRQEARIL